MSEWKETQLKKFAYINPKETLKKGSLATKIAMDFVSPFTKRIPMSTKDAYMGGVKFRNGDTIMARITPSLENGKTSYVDILADNEVGFGSTEFIVLRERKNISDKHFLYYLSISPVVRNTAIKSMTGSSGRQRVQVDIIKNYRFFAPPLAEQKAIAEVLSSLDDKIDLLHRQNKTLEQIAETLFRQWFIEEADDSWETTQLTNIVDIGIGRTPPRKERQWFSKRDSDIKWVSIKDLGNSGVYILDTSENLTMDAVKQFNIPIIPSNTLILSFKMTLGRVAITTETMLTNEAIAHFKLNNTTPFGNEFLYFYLKLYPYESLGTTSSIVTSINSTMIKNLEIRLPDRNLLETYKEKVKGIFKKIKFNQYQIQTLENLRDTLLPKLMNGDIIVKTKE